MTGTRFLRRSVRSSAVAPRRRSWARASVAGLVALVASATGLLVSPAAAADCATSSVDLVAHPDDDLFFMNPAIVQGIAAGGCSTTVYVTSGDAGGEDSYYLGREAGVRAAYAQMAGVTNSWTTSRVTFAEKSVTRATLIARPTVQLYYLRLPDGYVDGAGSVRSDFASLGQLDLGVAQDLRTLDTPVQTYSRAELVATLAGIITSAAPTTIRTLDQLGEYGNGDHSDHHAVGRLATEARAAAAPGVPLAGYLGYTTTALPANVSGSDLQAKEDAFFAYAPFDPGSCLSAEECAYGSSGDWLARQHTNTDTAGEPTAPTVPTGTNVAGSATVTASSQNAGDGQTAVKAVDGVVDGYPGDHTAEWASAGEGVGAWLQLDWAAPAELNAVVLHDRPNEYDQVTGATLTFSDGSSVAVPSLANDGAATTVTFPARSVSWVRVTVNSVAVYTGNVGLAELETWGTGPAVTTPTPTPEPTPAADSTTGNGAPTEPTGTPEATVPAEPTVPTEVPATQPIEEAPTQPEPSAVAPATTTDEPVDAPIG